MKLLQLYFLFFAITAMGQKNQKFPQEFNAVYYQSWVGGQELSGGGTDFYIEFKKPLIADIVFVKLYFRNYILNIEKSSETLFIARYSFRPEVVIDQYGNREIVQKVEEIKKPKYILKENEAMVEYVFKGKKRIYKFKNVKEKEFLAYP